MHKRPVLVVFCGIPGSGKSTIARILCSSIAGSVHIQTDAIRNMIAKPNYSVPESLFVYESCVRVAGEALRRGRVAVLDGTFARRSHRDRAIRSLRGLCGHIVIVHTVCSLETASLRNSSREGEVPYDRLVGMYRSFERPYGALKLDTEGKSATENATLILDMLRENSSLPSSFEV